MPDEKNERAAWFSVGGVGVPWAVVIAAVAIIGNAAVAQYRIGQLETVLATHRDRPGHSSIETRVSVLEKQMEWFKSIE